MNKNCSLKDHCNEHIVFIVIPHECTGLAC